MSECESVDQVWQGGGRLRAAGMTGVQRLVADLSHTPPPANYSVDLTKHLYPSPASDAVMSLAVVKKDLRKSIRTVLSKLPEAAAASQSQCNP